MIKISAIYQICIGIGMIGIWILLFITRQIPELQSEPIRIAMHILAEVTTGILLLISGLSILKKGLPHKTFYNLSCGALVYTLIASPGYYGSKGEWGVFTVFTIMLIISISFVVTGHRSSR